MIISLADATAIDPNITQDDLDAFEYAIRRLTNNNFQNKRVRFMDVEVVNENTMRTKDEVVGLRVGDTVEANYSRFNDGLYTVEEIAKNQIIVAGAPFYAKDSMMLTKVEYPADVKRGVKKLIEYDKKMANKVGIKSETISRMSTTYYDVNANDNTEGFPSSLLSFLKKYEKMRW